MYAEHASARETTNPAIPHHTVKLPAKRTLYPRFEEYTAPQKKQKARQKPNFVNSHILNDAQDLIEGFPSDVLSGRGTLYESFTRDNRVRGLGFILVVVGVLLFAFEFTR